MVLHPLEHRETKKPLLAGYESGEVEYGKEREYFESQYF